MFKFFKKSKQTEYEKRLAERDRVEAEYARLHPKEITVIQPETRSEMRLTRKGRYELGSDGKLTENGKRERLKHRYNLAIAFFAVATIAVYLFFFFVQF